MVSHSVHSAKNYSDHTSAAGIFRTSTFSRCPQISSFYSDFSEMGWILQHIMAVHCLDSQWKREMLIVVPESRNLARLSTGYIAMDCTQLDAIFFLSYLKSWTDHYNPQGPFIMVKWVFTPWLLLITCFHVDSSLYPMMLQSGPFLAKP